jgi:hypothetical protein
MVPVMCRRIAITSVLGLLLAGLGCNHIAGTSDCGANPADAIIAGPTPPYPATPATSPTGGPIGMPPAQTVRIGEPRIPEPKKVDEKKDEKKKDEKNNGNE